MRITPVILSGGSGTRLWPISRRKLPKQFIKLVDDETCFSKALQLTCDRGQFNEPLIIANNEHRFLVAEELLQGEIAAREIILEPDTMNTCPAIATACFYVKPEEVLLILPSDHLMKEPENFLDVVADMLNYAFEDRIITFGIKPDAPATGYGYIKKGKALTSGVFNAESFVEKPDRDNAKKYLNSGGYLWNSGIFMFRAGYFLELLKKHKPEIYNHSKNAVFNAEKDSDFLRLDADNFTRCEKISVDYAVMEKAENLLVAEVECGWRDLGNWQGLSDEAVSDAQGNNLIGDIITSDTENSYLHSENGLLVTMGLKNVVAFKTRDVTLIADKAQSENVRNVVEQLKIAGRSEFDTHAQQHKPWGSTEEIHSGKGYKIKRIIIKPRKKLSMQMHEHRAEHWVVVQGEASVICDDGEFILKVNESTFIPQGSKHRLENKGSEILEIIEIQTGAELSEDDIVRFEDDWGRK